MRVPWGHLPRLHPFAPRNLGPSQPEGQFRPRSLYRPKTFSVQGPRRTVELPEREWELLSLLFEYRGAYITRDTIISRIWGPYYVSQAKLFNEALVSLRAAMRHAGYPKDMIREECDLGIGIPDLDGEPLKRRRI